MKKNSLVLLLLLFASTAMVQGQKNFIDQNYIEVKGRAEMEIVPDEIYLNIHLDEEDTKSKETIEVLEKQMFVALEKAGVNLEKQLSVSDFSSNLRFHLIKRADIRKSKDFELLVNDAQTLAKVFLELERVKISNIDILRVDHSEIEKFKKQVKVNAIKAGKAKAEALTEAIGQKTGKAIYINETSFGRKNEYANTAIMMRGKALYSDAMEMPQLDFQKIKLEYSVMLRFALD